MQELPKLPGCHLIVMAFCELFAVRLYGGRGGTFAIINSVSAIIVAASLVAAHWYIPRSSSTMFSMVMLPPSIEYRPSGRATPSRCKIRLIFKDIGVFHHK